jgi:hypothetical protein
LELEKALGKHQISQVEVARRKHMSSGHQTEEHRFECKQVKCLLLEDLKCKLRKNCAERRPKWKLRAKSFRRKISAATRELKRAKDGHPTEQKCVHCGYGGAEEVSAVPSDDDSDEEVTNVDSKLSTRFRHVPETVAEPETIANDHPVKTSRYGRRIVQRSRSGTQTPRKRMVKSPFNWQEHHPGHKVLVNAEMLNALTPPGTSVVIQPRSRSLIVSKKRSGEVVGRIETQRKLKFRKRVYYERNIVKAINSTFNGTKSSNARTDILNQVSTPADSTLDRIQTRVILPAIRRLHKESVKRALEEYVACYRRTHPDHPASSPIPVALATDGRWQKRWGWNSLDGHVIGLILSPDGMDLNQTRNCVGVHTFHRELPGKFKRSKYFSKIKNWFEHEMDDDGVYDAEVFAGSAGSMDPVGLSKFVVDLLEFGLDVITIIHDDDTTGFNKAKKAKDEYIAAHPEAMFTPELKELLCLRHGAKNVAKSFVKLFKESDLPRHYKKIGNRNTWQCSTDAIRYMSKVFRDIMIKNTEVEEARTQMRDMCLFHLTGRCREPNNFCSVRRCWEKERRTNRVPLAPESFPSPPPPPPKKKKKKQKPPPQKKKKKKAKETSFCGVTVCGFAVCECFI